LRLLIILPATYSITEVIPEVRQAFTFNASGTYNLVIRDGNGCDATVAYEVYPQLEVIPLLTTVRLYLPAPNATHYRNWY
jgi:hypothetical protein